MKLPGLTHGQSKRYLVLLALTVPVAFVAVVLGVPYTAAGVVFLVGGGVWMLRAPSDEEKAQP